MNTKTNKKRCRACLSKTGRSPARFALRRLVVFTRVGAASLIPVPNGPVLAPRCSPHPSEYEGGIVYSYYAPPAPPRSGNARPGHLHSATASQSLHAVQVTSCGHGTWPKNARRRSLRGTLLVSLVPER